MPSLEIWHLCILIVLLLVIEGFYSGSEIALLSVDKLQLKKLAASGHKGAHSALELAQHPEKVFSTTLVVTASCVITLSTLIALFLIERHASYAELKSILISSPLVVLFGELFPKAFYQKRALRFAPVVAYPVRLTYLLLYPITKTLSAYTSRLARLVGPMEELLSGKKKSTREDLIEVLSNSKSETDIKLSERKIINRIFDFRESEAQHALIPLVKVDALELGSSVEFALHQFEKHRHSRMPVYADRIDNIIGILEASDLLGAEGLGGTIAPFISRAHYVAEVQTLEQLLLEMREEGQEMVVVVDEHGGAIGIITFEDIIEEIVGEISDEFDHESEPFKALSNDRWSVQAKTEITALNEALKLDLPEGDYETLSGFLLHQFGRIPKSKDELIFDTKAGSLRFLIKKATERHIEIVIIEKVEEKMRD